MECLKWSASHFRHFWRSVRPFAEIIDDFLLFLTIFLRIIEDFDDFFRIINDFFRIIRQKIFSKKIIKHLEISEILENFYVLVKIVISQVAWVARSGISAAGAHRRQDARAVSGS